MASALELPTTVVEDPGGRRPDPWRCYRACLAAADAQNADHVVIVQDDAIPCFDFSCWLNCLIRQEPEAVLVLFMSAMPRTTAAASSRALNRRQPFAPLHRSDFMPAVGICWPIGLARAARDWADAFKGRHTRSDDHMLGQWHRDQKPRVLVTVPSLIQHPDDTPSLIGNGNGSNGRNRHRTALFFNDD